MSNTVRCREAHGGKFTRPRAQWTGRKRAQPRSTIPAVQMAGMAAIAKQFSQIADRKFGQLAFRRKAGGS